jgi:YVTN family beta-propeller protein
VTIWGRGGGDTLSGQLQFSDGSSVDTGRLESNGCAHTVSFSPRTTSFVRWQVTGMGNRSTTGFREIEAYQTAPYKDGGSCGRTPTSNVYAPQPAPPATSGKAYVTNRGGAGGVAVLDLGSGRVVKTIPTGFHAQGITTNSAGTAIYAVNSDGNNVSQIDPSSDQVVATIRVEGGPVTGAVSPNGGHLYVTNYTSGTVSVINTALKQQTGEVSVYTAWGVAVSPDGETFAVTSYWNNTVTIFDAGTLAARRTIRVGLHPEGVIFNGAGSQLYVANNGSGTGATDGSMTVLAVGNGSVMATVPMVTPGELGRDVTTDRIYAAGASPTGTVYELDPGTNRVSRTFTIGSVAVDVTVSADGRFGYATNSNSNTVSILDLKAGTVVGTIDGLLAPHSIIVPGQRE